MFWIRSGFRTKTSKVTHNILYNSQISFCILYSERFELKINVFFSVDFFGDLNYWVVESISSQLRIKTKADQKQRPKRLKNFKTREIKNVNKLSRFFCRLWFFAKLKKNRQIAERSVLLCKNVNKLSRYFFLSFVLLDFFAKKFVKLKWDLRYFGSEFSIFLLFE